ncbi:hypothetical protein HMPREF9104_01377 [Lentilactobacillus kisonensis F0435]|uniref:Uncharacterized protein n=1 Tax=Lentilactobacillus kisonensis F0435 TaxID=797516 RepID=H1LFK1_9LACO|nr:hypothetical protein HMPREF9104_01377 [Lentilactobacillus kisonensis F0435]
MTLLQVITGFIVGLSSLVTLAFELLNLFQQRKDLSKKEGPHHD